MNADLVPIVNGLKDLPWLEIGHWVLGAIVALVVFQLIKGAPVIGRVARSLEELVFSNWRLALLGTTSIVLSLVAGYTTFDGLKNFTGGGMLSLLATIGIQGVMLVTAWLIGESFATGMNQRAPESAQRSTSDGLFGLLAVLLVFALLFVVLRWQGAAIDPFNWSRNSSESVSRFADVLLYAVMALVVLGIIVLNRQGELALPYIQGTRIIIKNAILWIMFLICMSTSVFFSFDSHFSGIFSQEERSRAAEIRAVNQIAGVVADIGSRIQSRQIDEAQRLFETDAWLGYEAQLDAAAKIANESPRLIREQISRELEEQKTRVAALEERKANAQSGAAGLTTRKTTLSEELSRIAGERPEVTSQVQAQKSVVAEIEKRLDEQRAKVLAEEKGVEGSGKVGQGQFWRAAKAEEGKVLAELQVARERLRPVETRQIAIDRRLGIIKSELAQIDGDLAKLRGESETAAQMITVAQSSRTTEANSFDPASGVVALDRARQQFRQKPEQQTLAEIQNQCAVLVSAASRVKDLATAATKIDCDPKQASEASGRVFALNAGLVLFAQHCAGGDRLPQTGGTDALLQFGRKCLQDSGLPSRDSAELAGRVSTLDLTRDDKAHRFVVTWNAFQDGNRLAYLALAIAITIDGLVFMSGLFGANAVRSPLSDVPSTKARSGRQLQDIIDNALLPHSFESARAVLSAMRPMTPRDGFTASIVLDDYDPHAADVRRVLNAAATIGAVRGAGGDGHAYEVRAELFEYLSSVSKRAFESNKDHANLAELERTISVALLPDVAHGAETVLQYMQPIQETTSFKEWVKDTFGGPHGFTAEIVMGEVEPTDQRIVHRALNAGSTMQLVQRRDQDGQPYYFVKGDFYKTLVRIRARLLTSAASRPQLAGPASGPQWGGRLDQRTPEISEVAKARIAPPESVKARPDGVAERIAQQLAETAVPDREPRDLQQLYNTFVTRLLSAAELDAGGFSLVANAELNEAAIDAGKAMDTLKLAARKLGQEVSRRERLIESLVERAYDGMRAEHRDDLVALETLEQAYREVSSSIAALMLAPRGPFETIINRIIRDLEIAAGPDDGHRDVDHQLLIRLRQLRSSLQMHDRRTAQSWEQVGGIVFAYDEGPTSIAMPRVATGH